MTVFIVFLFIGFYAMAGFTTGVYTRQRSVNKSYNRWLEFQSHYNNSEERRMLEAMADAKRYDSDDWAVAAFLGGFFWPAFMFGFGWQWVYKKVVTGLQPYMPKSEIEKKIDDIHKTRELEKQRLEMIRVGRKLNLDVTLLEKLGD